MTPSELSALDLACARALGKVAGIFSDGHCYVESMCGVPELFEPTRDTDECMRLAAERGYTVCFRNASGTVVILKDSWLAAEQYSDHSGDKLAGMRVAICRAVIAGHA